MTNSLLLKQCHFVGQSSILFPKVYPTNLFKACTTQTGYVFLSLIRGSYSYGEGTGAPPRDADSGWGRR